MRLGASDHPFADRAAASAFDRAFDSAIAAVPGVKHSGAVSALPFTSAVGWGLMNVEGFTPQPGQELQVDQRVATADYFPTMEIPLVRGRFFNQFDSLPDSEPVAIVDDQFAVRFWPGQNPVGKHVWTNPKRQLAIVGQVFRLDDTNIANAKTERLNDRACCAITHRLTAKEFRHSGLTHS